jgi:predicted phage terminase large subunit-like protein
VTASAAVSGRRLPTLDEVQAELARRDLYRYLSQAWPKVDPAGFQGNWHLEVVCDYLMAAIRGEIRRLIINIPPRSGKSTSVSVAAPTWAWIDQPQTKWLFASYAERLAIRDAVKSRRLLQSEWWQNRWGHKWRFAGDQNEKSRYENDKGGYRLSVGVGGSATGEGGDFLVIDDPHKVQEIESDTQRETVTDWFDQTMSTRLNDPQTGTIIVIMQRLHEGDLTGHLLMTGEWEHLCLPMEYHEKHIFVSPMDVRSEEGQLLHPERFPLKEVRALRRTLGARAAAGQLDQLPAPEDGDIFPRNGWRYWKPGTSAIACPSCEGRGRYGPEQEVCPHCHGLGDIDYWPQIDEAITSWDMSFKDTDGTDFVVGQVWGRKGARFYLLWQVRDRMSFTVTVQAFVALKNAWPLARAHLVEEKANGAAVIDVLKKKIPGIIAVNPKESKAARAHAVSPLVEAGDVWLPHPSVADWVDEYIEEHVKFDNGLHDDQVDATTQALARLSLRSTRVQLSDVRVWE